MKKQIKLYPLIAFFLLFSNTWAWADNSDKNVLFSVLELIKKIYVKEISDKKLVEAAISGMLTGLDPHSSFINEAEFEEIKTVVKGEFGGIGVEIISEPQGLRIISPIDDTPAFKAGLKPADLIFAVDDQLVANMTPAEAIKKMRGPKGSNVKISIIRDGLGEPLEISLMRDVIKANPVKYHLYNDVAYIRVSSFTNKTTEAVKKAIEVLNSQAEKNKIKGYILDVRNNPGGILEQSVSLTNLFIDNAVVVTTKDRTGKETSKYEAKARALVDKKIPLIVLINGGSASASEIVAGALQDYKRAIILGTKSFGKGSVQSIIELPGYGAIKITTSLYYTPLGRSIQAEGIKPDIEVTPAKIEPINNTDKKFEYSESTLKNHIVNGTKKENNDSVNNENIKLKEILKNKENIWSVLYERDYQLTRAIDIIKTMEILKKW